MHHTPRTNRALGRGLMVVGLATIALGLAVTLALSETARSDSTPITRLPPGPVSTTATVPGQLLAVALPHSSGHVWRLARRYDPRVLRQVSEADVGASVVLVYRVVGRGRTSLVFGLTRSDTSSTALKSVTHRIRSS